MFSFLIDVRILLTNFEVPNCDKFDYFFSYNHLCGFVKKFSITVSSLSLFSVNYLNTKIIENSFGNVFVLELNTIKF